MLLILLISHFGLATVHSAAIIPPTHLINEAQISPPPRNLSTAAFDIPPSLNGSLTPIIIDPRFTYEQRFAHQTLDKMSAYMSTLLALADLSTKGWTSILRWEAQYSLFSYGDVTVRIHAAQNPSTLQYRYAIWGLYSAIGASSAHGFDACVLTLYWSPLVGRTRHVIGYVSILGGSSLGISSGNFTEESLGLALSTQVSPRERALSNLTTTPNDSVSLATETTDRKNLKVEISLQGKTLDIDSVFYTMNTGIVYLSSWPQSDRVKEPGLIKYDVSRTFLRWDSSYLTAWPSFEYRDAIAALARLPAYMYEQNRFGEARFRVYVDETEVGRGCLYQLLGGISCAE
ncbi:MAG: hypothetical protein Q9175_005709 [Cornicularia normoerica]